MKRSSSDEPFLTAFKANFRHLGRRPVALYGIGEKTKLILEKISGFNFAGLMDKDTTGQTVYGLKVLSNEEAIDRVAAIIIVASMSFADLIYKRIAPLKRKHGIAVYFINGAVPREIDESVRNDSYWEKTQADLKRTIDGHDVVSFDLFDTLIMRTVPSPTDIFDLVEEELAERHGMRIDFKEKRIEAELHTYRNVDAYCSIHDIYRTLRAMLGIKEKRELLIKSVELRTEYACCMPRAAITECCRYAADKGKQVVITTDTFLTREHIGRMLTKCAIAQPARLLISCEERKSKHHGNLFARLKELYCGGAIVHIGDNPRSDGEMARNAGLHTFEIRSARDLLETSALKNVTAFAKTRNDRKVLGRLAGAFLNDPFSLHTHKGRLSIDSAFQIGYLSFGPLVANFLAWLLQTSRENKVDTLLFFARDGYILERLYRKLVEKNQTEAPASVYFLTSRRAACVAGIISERDIAFIVANLCTIKKITIDRLLFTAFGVRAHRGDSFTKKYFYEVTPRALLRHVTAHYLEPILDNAREERDRYRSYLNSLGILPEATIGCVNFIGRGVTQRFISAIMGKRLLGFYFAAEQAMSDILGPTDGVFALYGKRLSPFTDRSALLTKALLGETVFSSPDGQFVRFDREMRPVFDGHRGERDFSIIDECHKGMERFSDDMQEAGGDYPGMRISNDLADELYGLFSSPACVCSKRVKRGFVFSDYYNPETREVRLWLP